MSRVALALFTRDLRVHDNPALAAACADADQVAPVFVLDEKILASGFPAPNRAAFLAESLADLNESLRAAGGRLIVRHGDVVAEVARLAAEAGAARIHVAADVSAYSQDRERRLRARLGQDGRELAAHEGSVTVAAPGLITPAGRDHFAVFSPYHRRWSQLRPRRPLPPPRRLSVPELRSLPLPAAADIASGPASPRLAPGGEGAARAAARRWLAAGLDGYARDHDALAADATSRLSPYLRFGCLSPAELVWRAGQGGAGGEAFTRQLAWRDFHHQMLAARPEAGWRDYRDRHDRWRVDEAAFARWREGRTGFPIVDAGMRQLRTEGWMHNRARLITASLLAKSLYLDWRLGARHFQRLLLDADIADNQLNWQWVAGTGADTRPNRVLNPVRQGERYDPDGAYVRRWVPELSDLPTSAIHQPWVLPESARRELDYPPPIVAPAEATRRHRAV